MKKWSVVALFWGVQVITDIIRVSLAVVAPHLMTAYDISPGEMGWVLSAWNWGYTGCLLFVGPLVDRLGPWIIMGIGSGLWGLSTLSLPVASSAITLFGMRFLFGVAHSVRFPCQAHAITRWFPPAQRATAIGLCFSGGQIGLAVGAILAGFLLTRLGWQGVYYVIGAGSLAFTVLWLIAYPEKQIGRQTAIKQGESHQEGAQTSRFSLLRHRSVLGMVLGQMGYLYAYFFFKTWLPSYFSMELGMSIYQAGIMTSLPFFVGLLGTASGGGLGDYLISRGFSRTASRKTMIGSGLTLSMILMISSVFVSQVWMTVLLLILCMGVMRLVTASANSTPMDLAPAGTVGSLTSLQNFMGTLSGLLVAIITGYIREVTGSFVPAILLAASLGLVGAFCYVFVVERYETISTPAADPPKAA